jgi:hypothetical protein
MFFFLIICSGVVAALASLSVCLTISVSWVLDRASRLKATAISRAGTRRSCARCRTGLPLGTTSLAPRGLYRVEMGGKFLGTSEVRS